MRIENIGLKEVAEIFNLSQRTFCAKLPEWEGQGFPMPLPWNRRTRLYNKNAVLSWKARQERAQKCTQKETSHLSLVAP